jgi:hypothetical protein
LNAEISIKAEFGYIQIQLFYYKNQQIFHSLLEFLFIKVYNEKRGSREILEPFGVREKKLC